MAAGRLGCKPYGLMQCVEEGAESVDAVQTGRGFIMASNKESFGHRVQLRPEIHTACDTEANAVKQRKLLTLHPIMQI